MIQKLHITTTLAALVLFFLPWIDIQCSSKSVATQTGAQMIYGGGRRAPETSPGLIAPLGAGREDARADQERLGYSILIGLALAAVVAAAVLSFAALRSAPGRRKNLIGLLCANALALIVVQVLIGFPVKKALAESVTGSMQHQFGSRTTEAPDDKKMKQEMIDSFVIHYLPAFYLELLMLAVPTLILANDWIDRIKEGGTERVKS